MKKQFTFILFLMSAVLVAAAVVLVRFPLLGMFPAAQHVASDFLVIVAIILLFIRFRNSRVLATAPTTSRLNRLGWTSAAFILLILIISQIVRAPSFDPLIGTLQERAFSNNTVFISFVIYLVLLLSVYIFIQLYGLVLIKRKKRTKTLLWALYASLLVYLVFCSFTRKDPFAAGYQASDSLLQSIAFDLGFLTIFFMVMNSYRNAWISYLNKQQKILCLIIGIMLAVSLITAGQLTGNVMLLYLQSHSLSAAIFFNMTGFFLLIYMVLAIISLLLHLPSAGVFDKKVRQLTSLFRISSAVATMLQYDRLLLLAANQTLEVVEADSAWLMMRQKDSGSFALSASSNISASLRTLIKSREFEEVTTEITKLKKACVYNTLRNQSALPLDKETRRSGSSLIGVPLISPARGVFGILYAYKGMDYAFDHEDSAVMESFANQTSAAIDNSRLLDESLEKERLQQELNVAREIQLKLLPKEIPVISEEVLIEAVSVPAHEVGGDYYDFVQLDEHLWGIYVGDVSGKSVSAALYMAEIKGFIQSLARLYHSPLKLLQRVNETLYANIDRRSFISFLAVVIDMKKKKAVFTRAGHTPLGYYDPELGRWSMLQPKGMGLGLDKGPIFNKITEEKTVDFKPGCVLFLYTDGVTEIFNKEGEEFGEERLLEILERCNDNSADTYCDVIMNEINSYSHKSKPDDITMVALHYKKPG
ncbi:PP2C family protein-serine/threonine phosphatase [candidate division KSB1 bacterium]